jgi:hypothetical protein
MSRHLTAQHEAHADILASIERAAARVTVDYFGVDAIWVAPTRQGAEVRASLCLARGDDPATVAEALGRWTA